MLTDYEPATRSTRNESCPLFLPPIHQPEFAMTPIGIQRIEKRLDAFDGLIDMADWANRPSDQRRGAFLSRAVAAYAIKMVADIDNASAARSITDSFHDRGIDAIFFDARQSRLLIVQSKWSDGLGFRDAGDFCDGVARLIKADWASFANNPKIASREQEVNTAMMISSLSIILITAHKGPVRGDGAALNRVDELVAQIDGGSGLATSIHWHQQHLLESIQDESSPPSINADLYFANWGQIKDPYHAVYGRVQARAIRELWLAHPHMAHMNIREFAVHRTDVNAAIANTISKEPKHFWYFNNGLTLICDLIKPAVFGALKPELGLFHFEGIRLVNGAQTTGIVSNHLGDVGEAEQNEVWIQVRAIAVGKCPDGFATQITKFTNLQNAVTRQDFVAMDPVQSRIAIDFAVERRTYSFKWGPDPEPNGVAGCTLREATVALACADPDVWFTVTAKREIGQLWDTESDRYKRLYYKELTAQRVWNAVTVMRSVDATLASVAAAGGSGKTELVAVHLRLVILHLVFHSLPLADWSSQTDLENLGRLVAIECKRVFTEVCDYILKYHESEYLASLSKNYDKCDRIIRAILAPKDELTLFKD